ncbi:glycosyltransferase involved in cell wall biosynthesis [Thermocatellispora tengchongensis]|uniref:Glycosyltransferase involved in cell wall biosynthesis n=1 Tax=Thermocatellispora tengchongensis TaxID=1073253 RepID=A0A840PVJ2_9ACTN|nr:glycosyltransferase family 4 protein [Thermocatellispora tengchongensis]MBB5139905.1 glycosyltransferase involved in cell wall biosynthesis [Thermocatellispora tengchongensis]
MRVLVYPHTMELGGSQLNAVELAGAVQRLGHEVMVISEPGPLVDYVTAAGLPHVELDPARRRPARDTVRMIRALAEERGLDVIHGYEWPPGVEAYWASLGCRASAVCTVMSMSVAPFLPPSLPLVVGTREIQLAAERGRRAVHLIEPPVDTEANAPGHPVAAFRERFGLAAGPFDLVAVTRLAPELKLEGLLTAIGVVGRLATELNLRLIVVGDGPARAEVEQHAAAACALAGRRAVVLTGQLADPRPAYAAATACLGMGGSALRAMAFAKPLIVQGELGFFELLTPDTEKIFLEKGWYGLGAGRHEGGARFEAALRRLHEDPGLRVKLGEHGRALVVRRFSLERAAHTQVEIYERAVAERPVPGDRLGVAAGVLAYKLRRRYQRLRGTDRREDFNAVARTARR